MKRYKIHRGASKRNLKKFGDLIAYDSVDFTKVDDGCTRPLRWDCFMHHEHCGLKTMFGRLIK